VTNGNDDGTKERLEQLEEMDKLLLRAQVLQQRALEILQKTVEEHGSLHERQQEWQERHQEWQEKQEKWREEYEERWRRIDTGLAEATDKINFLIDREMRRQGGPEAHA
jgi:hypothetical protein